ncbi:P3 protein [Araneus ventricosus]|uniref:P3 protein n=1 Tax=Araneus ventricosus TaxID=182803 RepID=A0A4Y2F636_ARAVE|nr:P3 protein [Araneus ventricosus]
MAWLIVTCLVLCTTFADAAVGTNIPSLKLIPEVDFHPTELLGVEEEQVRDILFEINWTNATNETLADFSQLFPKDFYVTVASGDSEILEIVNSSYSNCISLSDEPHNSTIVVRGIFLGYTTVKVSLKAAIDGCGVDVNDEFISELEENSRDFEVPVSVIRPPSILVNSVTGVFAVLVAFNFINMGVQLDMDSIKKVLKKPIGPAIGFVCQFLFMPLASYGISLLLFSDNSLRLGLFTLGCSPGGSMSNFWTLLFNGDVNLSVTMTFISTVAALGMMPLWIFTLGASLFREREAAIPYLNMVGSLVGLTFPIIIGLLIKKYSPKLTRISLKIIKPFTIIIVLFGITLASYVNRFVFYLFTWQVVVAGLSIAWGGYCFGALVSWMFRLEKAQIIAISIETAFQNPAVAFVLLLLTLPQPGADLASVPVVAQLMLTGIPMWILLLGTRVYTKIKGCREMGSTGEITKPEIDTVQKRYFAVETNPLEERVYYNSKANKLDMERYSIQ